MKKLKSKIDDLNKDIAALRSELESLNSEKMKLSGPSKYCNFTLMKEDALIQYNETKVKAADGYDRLVEVSKRKGEEFSVLAADYAVVAKAKSAEALKDGKVYVSEAIGSSHLYVDHANRYFTDFVSVASPHVEAALAKVGDLYAAHVKPFVDANVVPVYEEHLSEHVKAVTKVAGDFYSAHKPLVVKYWEKFVNVLKNLRLSFISLVAEGAKVARDKYQSENKGQGIDEVLR